MNRMYYLVSRSLATNEDYGDKPISNMVTMVITIVTIPLGMYRQDLDQFFS